MTLDSHSALNRPTVFRVDSFSMDALVLRHDRFKIDGNAYIVIYCQRQACSPLCVVSGDISLMPIFVGVRC